MLGNLEKILPNIAVMSEKSIPDEKRRRGNIAKIVHDRYFWYVIILAVFIGVFIYAPDIASLIGLDPLPDWELAYSIAIYRVVFVLSVAIAAWRFGTSGGMITTVLLTPIVFSPFIFGLREINIWLELGLFTIGIVVSLLIGRQGKMQRLLAQTAGELQQQTNQLRLEIAERRKAEEEFRTLSLRAIESLVFALEAKDEYTAGHSRRVADIAIAIGRRMNLSVGDLSDLRCSSLLHDIGKIAVEQFVQNKPGSLTPHEYEHIMIHVQAGAEIVRPIVNEKVLKMIKHHHDHYDGGNLHQLAVGEGIPLGARILAVADAFDAMTSDRSYRAAMSVEEATVEIKKCIGTQFDPIIVDNFLGIPMNHLKSILE